MRNIAIAFDLHNTLMSSNDAWISAYVALGGERVRDEVTQAVYKKCSRKEIAQSLGVSYDEVYARYCELVRPVPEMRLLLDALKGHFSLWLISSASETRVYHDLEGWNGDEYFDLIATKECFCKDDAEDWHRLMQERQVKLLIYIGNDVEEDIPDVPRVISFICGDFLQRLNRLGLLIKREEM